MTQTYIVVTFLAALFALIGLAILIICSAVFAAIAFKREKEEQKADEIDILTQENDQLREENEGLRKALSHLDVAQEREKNPEGAKR